ncbi:MAG: carboxypeptidase regulatory-like domain-containing protein [Anaerolineae bacterium]|nr:carboxypeptidase regulatory-like domain-containing protein [Gemmatimonadaceae bacterium]
MTSDDALPIMGAQVSVTRGPDRAYQTTTSDGSGRWRIRFAQGTGDYLVHIAAPERKTFRKRVTRGSAGQPGLESVDSVYTVDAVLPVAITELATVHIAASKATPERAINHPTAPPGPGGAERWVDDFTGALSPDLAGNIAEMAGTTAGVVPTANGVSVLGLSAGQTNTTLGGLQFNAADLPRDVRTFTRVSTSTYDPSLGWFGGARVAVNLSPGSTYAVRSGHITVDAPALQTRDSPGTAVGQRLSALHASVGGEGGLADDRLSYNVGVQAGRRRQDAISILDVSDPTLLATGVEPDSASRFIALLTTAGIRTRPRELGSGDGERTTDRLSFVGRLGNPYFDYKKFEPVRRIAGVTVFGNWRQNAAFGIGPTSTPSRGGELTQGGFGIQGHYSRYITKRDWLFEARSGLSASEERWTPSLALPGAQVLVGSVFPGQATENGASGLIPLSFGGNGFLESLRRAYLWETQGSFAFYHPGNNLHQMALAASVRLDGVREVAQADRQGTFTYQSLDDLAANRPASFTRALRAPEGTAQVWNAFLSFGDDWRVSPALQVLYGFRVEGNLYGGRPAFNPGVYDALQVRTDQVPNRLGVSPRFGFTWNRTAFQDGYSLGSFGNIRIPYRSVVRGGIGEFRSLLGPDMVAAATQATGLPGASQSLFCSGPAVPTPEWAAWVEGTAAIPSTCASGFPTVFSDAAPAVYALHPGYKAPRSWRANLAWTGVRWKAAYNIEGIYSLNLNQVGTTDANFAGVERFLLPEEGRPVYVPEGSIDQTTGVLSPVEARRSAELGGVIVQRSDLRSVSRQLSITLSPTRANLRRWWTSGSYVLGSVRQLAYGFDGAAFDDPRQREWSRGDLDVRHQFLLQAGLSLGSVTGTLFGRVTSGYPYTPLIGSDVNGDGRLNDRAFVFDPSSSSTNPALASATNALLNSASGSVADCLRRTLGRVASRNGCEGPWSAALNARIAVNGTALGLGERAVVAFNFSNPLAGLDRLVHGNRLRGWGQVSFPDPVLLRVRGFDASAQRFEYATNPRFGHTRSSAMSLQVPFRVTLDISINLAPPLTEQALSKWLAPGRRGQSGPRLSADDIRKRYARGTRDGYSAILQHADSLFLSPAQVADLKVAQLRIRARTDSVWTGWAEYLAKLDDSYNISALIKRQTLVADSVWEVARMDFQSQLPRILTKIQIDLLPPLAADLYLSKGSRKRSHFFF